MEALDTNRVYSVLENYKDDSIIHYIKDHVDFIGYRLNSLTTILKTVPQVEVNITNDLTLLDTIYLVKEFLATIDKKYVLLFEQCINDGSFNMFDSEDENNLKTYPGEAFRTYNMDEFGNYHENINIPLSHTIEDVFTIVHEFIHLTNFKPGAESEDRDFFTEVSSITHEFLLFDYLKNNNICTEDIAYPLLERMENALYNSNYLIDFLNKANKIDINKVQFVEDEKQVLEDYKCVIDGFKYPVGTYFAIINYANYKKGLVSLDNLKSFNESLLNCDNFESLRHILLDIPNNDDLLSSVELLKNEIFSGKNMSK